MTTRMCRCGCELLRNLAICERDRRQGDVLQRSRRSFRRDRGGRTLAGKADTLSSGLREPRGRLRNDERSH